MVKMSVADRWPDAVDATQQLAQYSGAGAKWAEVEPYMHCLFELADDRRDASPGDLYRRK